MFQANEDQLKILRIISEDEVCLEIGRKAIEDYLVALRDSRILILDRNNGLVIKEKDGTRSSIIRMGPETAIKVGLKAIIEWLQKGNKLDE